MKAVNLIGICLLVLAGCRQGNHSTDIVRYAEQERSGLRKEVRVGKWRYTMQYKPTAYMLIKEQVTDPAERAERQQQLSGMAWFNISFRIEDFSQSPLRYELPDMEVYNARLHYFLNEAPADIYLLYGGDTLHVSGYGFDNNHNLTPHETMVVGFALPAGDEKPVADMQLAYYDRVFGNGIVKATIRKEQLAAIPSFEHPVQTN